MVTPSLAASTAAPDAPVLICAATKDDGQPCRARALPGSPLCLFHDPDRQEELRASRSRGGATPRRRLRRLPVLLDHMHVAELMSELLVTAMNAPDTCDPKRLNALSGVARVLLKSVGTPRGAFLLHADRRETASRQPHLLRVYPAPDPQLEALLAEQAEAEPEPAAGTPAALSPEARTDGSGTNSKAWLAARVLLRPDSSLYDAPAVAGTAEATWTGANPEQNNEQDLDTTSTRPPATNTPCPSGLWQCDEAHQAQPAPAGLAAYQPVVSTFGTVGEQVTGQAVEQALNRAETGLPAVDHDVTAHPPAEEELTWEERLRRSPGSREHAERIIAALHGMGAAPDPEATPPAPAVPRPAGLAGDPDTRSGRSSASFSRTWYRGGQPSVADMVGAPMPPHAWPDAFQTPQE